MSKGNIKVNLKRLIIRHINRRCVIEQTTIAYSPQYIIPVNFNGKYLFDVLINDN